MQERLIATIDVGTSKISLAVCEVKDGCAQVLYFREVPSDGVRRGNIFNPKKTAGPVSVLIKDAEQSLGIKITQLVAGLPRWKVNTSEAEASSQRDENSFIEEADLEALEDIALGKYRENEEKGSRVYKAVVQSYSTEDMYQVKKDDIIGIASAELSGSYKVFSGLSRPINNLTMMTNLLEMGLGSSVFIPDAVAQTTLTSDDMDHGVALVEIGAGVTTLSIYHRSILRFYDSVPFGGASVTTDIKTECGIDDVLAENIKLAYGSCTPDKLLNLSEKTLQINDDFTGDCQQISVKYLSEIIGSRMREIFAAILHLIGKSGYAEKLRSGIVITGGGAELLGCSALLAEMSGLPIRFGYPVCRNIATSGFSEIKQMRNATQIALISCAREDEHLICGTYTLREEPKEGNIFTETEMGGKPEKQKEKPTIKEKGKEKGKGFGGLIKGLFEDGYEDIDN